MPRRLSQALMDLAAIKQTITNTGGFRLHFKYSRGGTVTCRMWHPDGFILGRAGGGGYDKKGTAFGEALTKLFPAEIKALPLPTRDAKGRTSGLYGMGEHEGKRYLDGACGFESMVKIAAALGFDVESYETSKDSTMVIGRKVQQ